MVRKFITEASRRDLIDKGKRGDSYSPKNQKKGRNRFERRRHSKIYTNVAQYNNIDMNAFFKKDLLIVGIKVIGETDEYIVKIKFEGVLKEIEREVKNNNNKLEFKNILTSLIRKFNTEDVFVNCSCLHPTTKIKLLDGTSPTVEEMKERFEAGEKLFVFSTDEKGDFKPGEVENVWITKTTNEFIKITLDNDEEILTTPDHLYMLRDGSYVMAEELTLDSSLMPMYTSESNGYTTVKLNSETRGWRSVYKIVADTLKKDEIETTKLRVKEDNIMPYDVAIHHRDFNKKNNHPDNLEIMTAEEHWNYHASLSFDKLPEETKEKIRKLSSERIKKLNANPTEKMLKARKAFVEKGRLRNYDEDRKQQQSKIMRDAMAKYYAETSEDELRTMREKYRTDEYKEKLSSSQKKVWNNYTDEEYSARCEKIKQALNDAITRERLSDGVKKYHNNLTTEKKLELNRKISKGVKNSWKDKRDAYLTDKFKKARKEAFKFERTSEIVEKTNLTKIKNIIQRIIDAEEIPSPETYKKYKTNGYPNFTKCFSTWKELSNYFNLNHKIIKIERIIVEDTPVYDISVKDYHNFVVDAGVVLHNCEDWKYRQAYWATQNNYNSGYPEIRVSNITNPNDTKGSGCKHVMLVLSNMDWIMKVCSVINNYIKYAKQSMQRLYADYIFPKIYGVNYNKAVQLDLFDTDDLDSSPYTIDDANRLGRKSGQFKTGNPYRFKKQEKPDENALNLKFTNSGEKSEEELDNKNKPVFNKSEQ